MCIRALLNIICKGSKYIFATHIILIQNPPDLPVFFFISELNAICCSFIG
jgi:hypothetical protein